MDNMFTNSAFPSEQTPVTNPLSERTEDSPYEVLSFIGENFHKLPEVYSSLNIGPEIKTPMMFSKGVSFKEQIVSGIGITSAENKAKQRYLKITPIVPESIEDEETKKSIKAAIIKLIDATLIRNHLIAIIDNNGTLCLRLS